MKTAITLCIVILCFQNLYSQQSPFDTTIYGKNAAAGHTLQTRGLNNFKTPYRIIEGFGKFE